MSGIPRMVSTALLWCGVVILCTVGVVAAFVRTVEVSRALVAGQLGPELSARDRRTLEQLAATIDVKPGTKEFKSAEEDATGFAARFVAHPAATFLHIVPGALFLVFAPLQFSTRLRSRWIAFHRWTGRLLLATAVCAGLSAFFFGQSAYAGAGEASAVFVFGAVFLFAAIRAFIAIRRRDVACHREWMIRAFAVALGISTIRIVSILLLALTHARPRDLLAPSFWIGWTLTLGFAELWIRHTRVQHLHGGRPAVSAQSSAGAE